MSRFFHLLRVVPYAATALLSCSNSEQPERPALELNLSDLMDAGFESAPSPNNHSNQQPLEDLPNDPTANQGASENRPGGDISQRSAAPDPKSEVEPKPAVDPTSNVAAPTLEPAPQPLPIAELSSETKLVATTVATTVYNRPHASSRRLGYIRLGGVVERDPDPVPGSGCKGKWYRIEPVGYVCTADATTDVSDPLARATRLRPDVSKPLPYRYGFVRATAPQYLRIPTRAEQLKSEFKLDEHLQWYHQHYGEVQRVTYGANDVPIDDRGFARLGLSRPPGEKLSTQLLPLQLLGAKSPRGAIPFWLDGKRHIPNVSSFQVPEYAVFADRVRRKTGLSFVDAFMTEDDGVERGFAVTVDMRLIPTTKVKPDTGSPFHGVELGDGLQMPFAFIVKRNSKAWRLIKGRDEALEDTPIPRRAIVPVTGNARIKAGQRFYQLARMTTRWVRGSDVGVVAPPQQFPPEAEAGERWIDVSLRHQTLVLYEGKRPVYATLVSTGRDRLGDPETTLATPQGSFRVQSKHIAAAMDSEENSTVSGGTKVGRKISLDPAARATRDRLIKAERSGAKLSEDDRRRLLNIKKGRHPEYGVTRRRGAGGYELRDVPWIQYFQAGYALHGAYWHDVFGVPRSHGCINLAPIDARIVFNFTEPKVPPGWHGFNVSKTFGTGTLVHVRE